MARKTKKQKKFQTRLRILIASLVFILIAINAAVIFLDIKLPVAEKFRIYSMFYENEEAFEESIKSLNDYEILSQSIASILPSDPLMIKESAAFYDAISEMKTPKTILLIGKNENYEGIYSCDRCRISTNYGNMKIADDLIDDLAEKNILLKNDYALQKEDSLNLHFDFIAKYFPNTEILPISLNVNAEEETIKLKNWIEDNIEYRDLIILSMDFSKYSNNVSANLDNISSVRSIENFDISNVFDLDIENHAALFMLMSVLDSWEAKNTQIVDLINTESSSEDLIESTNTYELWSFSKGENKTNTGMTILSFGNSTEDDAFLLSSNYKFDENYDLRSDYSAFKNLQNIKGVKDNFFVGYDFIVFNLVEDECRLEEANYKSILFCKFVENSGLSFEEESQLLIDKMDTFPEDEEPLVYVEYEFKNSDTDNIEMIAKDMADYGADIFMGKGIFQLLPMELYNQSILIYSLGDFLPDSKLMTSQSINSSGAALAINLSSNYFELYLMPVDIVNSKPQLMGEDESREMFANFIKNLNLSLGIFEMDAKLRKIKISTKVW